MDNKDNMTNLKLGLVIIALIVVVAIVIGVFTGFINLGGSSISSNTTNTLSNTATNIANTARTDNSSRVSNSTNTNTTNSTSGGNSTVVSDFKSKDFNFDFLNLEIKDKNMIYSPLSINYALHMLADGADGNTKAEIDNVVGNLKLNKYYSIENVLSFANGIYINEKYKENIKATYTDLLKTNYDADVKFDEFRDANNINKWIEDKTLGIIKNMLPDEMVQDPMARMFLINALAIDMKWANKFETDHTAGRTFYKLDGTEMEATTMFDNTSSDTTKVYVDNDVTVLSKDLEKYEGNQFEFIAIMPKADFVKYSKDFNTEKINDLTAKLKKASDYSAGVDLYIPKFKFSYDLGLKNDLISLGIKDAFSATEADFRNMSEVEQLYVSEALHKADIEFSEDGIKAAAVTIFAMKANAMFMQEEPLEVKFDKPFMFVIREKNTKDIWFVGAVFEPNKWENDKAEYTASENSFGF